MERTARCFPFLCLAALVLLAVSCSGGFPPEFPAPDFTLKSPQTGNSVTLSALKGKPVIIYWFTSW
ncbi:MAG: redoxin domain-containing protein [Nitrospirae bacterium]|nr:redoxin domain-containing protein [Nitrospirota bacterium]